MKKSFLIFIALFLVLYGWLNYYIGTHIWQVYLGLGLANMNTYFWVSFWITVFAYPIGRMATKALPRWLINFLNLVGSIWMGMMFYMFILWGLLDLIRLILGWFGVNLNSFGLTETVTGVAVVLFVDIKIIYGFWKSRRLVVATYEAYIPKAAGRYQELKIAMVSDLHLGSIMHRGRLARIIEKINALKPDLILLAGDIIDEDLEPFINERMGEEFRKLTAPLGTYAVPGNHEYISRRLVDFVDLMEEAGVRVLLDSYEKVADSFYVIGRKDISGGRFTGDNRKPLSDILEGAEKSLPLILMDHQPSKLEEPQEAGIDLQVSGHTHRGQIFPNQWITGRIFENDWGFLKKGDLHLIVSSGAGTWGPPMRSGSNSEVVEIRVKFK